MKTWLDSSYLSDLNQCWIEWLYRDFLIDPNLVDANWRFIFQQLSNTEIKPNQFYSKIQNRFCRIAKNTSHSYLKKSYYDVNKKQIKVLQLINSYRLYGYQYANLDPLKLWKHKKIAKLDLSFHDLNKDDFQKKFDVDFFANKNSMKLSDLIKTLKQIYCGSIGIEYMHIDSAEEKDWIQQHIEFSADQVHNTLSVKEKKRFLSELTAAEGLEHFLNIKFPGAKRFSLEGGDVLIPMLKEIFRYAGNNGTRRIILGMTHRGRINVLINVLGKKPKDIFNEFTGKYEEYFGTGDVKYHKGFSSYIETENGLIHLTLAFNPSHLEIINPVVMGSVRAHIDHLKEINSNNILSIIIHGDAAIVGQGVVQETLNMSQTRGYEVGGTIHIIINNQIGFTTSNPLSTIYNMHCTDIGKMIQAPIFHVNADDLEAVVFVAHLALDFRNYFKHDVFIDLVCYRRYGHNEADEPSVTQPIMYQKIKEHPTSRKIYATKLETEKVSTLKDATKMLNRYLKALDIGECVVKEWRPMNKHSFTWSSYLNHTWDEDYPNKVEISHLQYLAQRISTVPEEIKMQPLVAKIYAERQAMAIGKKLLDWGSAENLAYATLVDQGISVRLSGEDSSRGTFFHRHAIVHNQKDGVTYTPLQHIHSSQGQFRVLDSILSEEAVLAFEYGYSIADPNTLTIWEAQFGDFANGAQVVIDQFISSGEQKWGLMCGLVMLLPHGYEGHGPEHSSARLERYLQLCAEQNMQVCIPSTPAQIYHVLRRQVLRSMRRPLVIISPKSLLHHQLVTSNLDELSNGIFMPVIGEIDKLNPKTVKRVIICSGKVYYDLLIQRRKNNQKDVVIIRIEQLYPFPYQAIRNILKLYTHVRDFVWCQEEPLNQGAWYYSQHYFRKIIPSGSFLRYIGRQSSASPAVGYMSVHQRQQKHLVDETLQIN